MNKPWSKPQRLFNQSIWIGCVVCTLVAVWNGQWAQAAFFLVGQFEMRRQIDADDEARKP